MPLTSEQELIYLIYRELISRGVNFGDIDGDIPMGKFIIREDKLFEAIFAIIDIIEFNLSHDGELVENLEEL